MVYLQQGSTARLNARVAATIKRHAAEL